MASGEEWIVEKSEGKVTVKKRDKNTKVQTVLPVKGNRGRNGAVECQGNYRHFEESGDGHWCRECEFMFPDSCGKHGCLDTVEDNVLPTKAYYTLPDHLTIQPVLNPSGNYRPGVFTTKKLKARTKFGPVEAPVGCQQSRSKRRNKPGRFELQIEEKNVMVGLELEDEEECNWMMFIQPARNRLQQNLVAILHKNQIYYVTIKNIPTDGELRVWYSAEYAVRLGKLLSAKETEEPKRLLPLLGEPCHTTEIDREETGAYDPFVDVHFIVNTGSADEGVHENDVDVNLEVITEEDNEDDYIYAIDIDEDNDVEDDDDTPRTKPRKTTSRKAASVKRKRKTKVKVKGVDRKKLEESRKLRAEKRKLKETSPRKPRYVCEICEEGFQRDEAYKLHVASHSGTLPYNCEFPGCSKGFKNKFLYIRHQVIHQDSSTAIITCPYCMKTFHRKDHFKNHLLIHDLNRNTWKCDRCGKSYIRHESFRFHQAMHHAEDSDEHDCLICEKVLPSREEHLSHLKDVHNRYQSISGKERTIKCPECDKKFLCMKEVKRHMVVHTKRKDYLCEYCSQVFGRKDHLSRHYKSAHPGGVVKKDKTPKSVKSSVKSVLSEKRKLRCATEELQEKDTNKAIFKAHIIPGHAPSILHIPQHESHQGRFIPPSYEDITSRSYIQQPQNISITENRESYSTQGLVNIINGTTSSQLPHNMLISTPSCTIPAFNNPPYTGQDSRSEDTDHSYMLSDTRYRVGQMIPSITHPAKIESNWNSEEMKKREFETVGYLQSFALGSNQPGQAPWDPSVNFVPVLQQLSAIASTEQNMT